MGGNVNYSADTFTLARPFSLSDSSVYTELSSMIKKSHTAVGIQNQKWKSKWPQNLWQRTKWSYWKIDMKIWTNISNSGVSHICFSRHADTKWTALSIRIPLGAIRCSSVLWELGIRPAFLTDNSTEGLMAFSRSVLGGQRTYCATPEEVEAWTNLR